MEMNGPSLRTIDVACLGKHTSEHIDKTDRKQQHEYDEQNECSLVEEWILRDEVWVAVEAIRIIIAQNPFELCQKVPICYNIRLQHAANQYKGLSKCDQVQRSNSDPFCEIMGEHAYDHDHIDAQSLNKQIKSKNVEKHEHGCNGCKRDADVRVFVEMREEARKQHRNAPQMRIQGSRITDADKAAQKMTQHFDKNLKRKRLLGSVGGVLKNYVECAVCHFFVVLASS